MSGEVIEHPFAAAGQTTNLQSPLPRARVCFMIITHAQYIKAALASLNTIFARLLSYPHVLWLTAGHGEGYSVISSINLRYI